MTELFPPTIDDQIACVTREITMRKRVYGRRVAEGRMTAAHADLEMWNIEAVLATLERVKAQGGL